MWSVGCTLLDLLLRRKSFPGDDPTAVLASIVATMGPPPADWGHDYVDRGRLLQVIDTVSTTSLHHHITRSRSGHVSRDLVDLLHGLLQYDPKHRLTAAQALRHAWFRGEHALPSQLASACRAVIGRIEDPDAAFLDDARLLMDIRHQLDRTVMEQLGEFHMALDQLDQTSGAQKDIYRMRFIMAMSRCIDRCNMPKLQAVAAMLRERAKRVETETDQARGWSDASNMIEGLDTMIRAMDMEKNRML
ncbi:putative cyclin-dependent serine/threonine-protein kinase [Tetrabaena socialis]|uniref:Putative cyclin-dependent serine/threonine-protein kinase n=1 Tax=Tetrabaena socialis TaxID=47790 RepID=A0A2J7ZHI6_9CHLO|nr:putative cyclin-dependent serine/threonine-protein kinase [Tetrabaena socialis]|eukprot:PNG99724.1 putative cyclin-dependent serine/threonine-protein kinase [Tetrabaena socialis]